MILFFLTIINVLSQTTTISTSVPYAGCQCCGTGKECDQFQSEWSILYACVIKVPEYIIEKYDIN